MIFASVVELTHYRRAAYHAVTACRPRVSPELSEGGVGVATRMTGTRESACSQPRLRRIEGRHNPLLKQLRQAFSRAQRTDDGDCAIEGLRMLEEAIRSGLRFRAVFFRESALERAERLLPQIGAHVETLLLPDKLFDASVPSETPQGVAALVRLKEFSLDDVLENERLQVGPIVALAGLQDPGNLGTIIRSAEAFGSAGIILGEGTVSPLNAKAVRASAGSIFRLPVVAAAAGLEDVVAKLRAQKRAIDCDFFAQGDAAGSRQSHRAAGNLHWKRGFRVGARLDDADG